MPVLTKRAKFDPGQLYATPGFMKKVNIDYAISALIEHVGGSWGCLTNDDWKANNDALEHGGRLLSVYPLPNESETFYVITEADRSQTTFLLPSEY